MKNHARVSLAVAVISALPAIMLAQQAGYPITVIPTGKGPFTFPAGYQTPWERIEIMVTEKMSPNLFVLHGSQGLDPAHPDASGGRAMALFGPDGVLLVDTENRQVADKTLKTIRSFTTAPIKILVNTHIHSDHTGANAFFTKQGAVIFSQTNLQSEMLRPLRAPTASRRRRLTRPAFPWRLINTTAAPGEPAITLT
jgi:glyoxylase-like metal-dependent hydrolase (beta-lactamase superfamily II)